MEYVDCPCLRECAKADARAGECGLSAREREPGRGPHPLELSRTDGASRNPLSEIAGIRTTMHGSARDPADSHASDGAARIRQEASANCANALIGQSVEKWASDRGPCLRSQLAPIAPMPRFQRPKVDTLTGRTSKSDSE